MIAHEHYVGDTFVQFALMRDIANGLIAIHQSFVGAHGQLSSECCMINDRWQVRISDFGLNMIREAQPPPLSKASQFVACCTKCAMAYENLCKKLLQNCCGRHRSCCAPTIGRAHVKAMYTALQSFARRWSIGKRCGMVWNVNGTWTVQIK